MKRKEKQSTKTEVQRFRIRKYSVGTISVLTAIFFIANGHVSEASKLDHEQESNNGNNITMINSNKDNAMNSNQDKQAPSDNNFKLKSSNAPEAFSQQSSEISPVSQKDLVKQKAPTIQDAPTEKQDTTIEKNNRVNQSNGQKQLADVDNENKVLEAKKAEEAPNKAEAAPNKAEAEKVEKASNKAEAEKAKETPNKTEAEKVEEAPNKTEAEKAKEAPNKAEVEKVEEAPNKAEAEKAKETPNKTEAEKAKETLNKTETAQTDIENKNEENSNEQKVKNLKTKNGFNPNKNEVKQESKNNPTKVKDLEANKQATTRNRSKVQQTEVETLLNTAKKAEQGVHVNKYPIILVHGFLGLMDGNKPDLYPTYWGGKKYKVKEALEKAGYEVYEASISAVGSNYGRAVELYHFIKGGQVDYGAAHAAKYGHNRYGKTYKGVMPNWEPGQKVHLIGHSMGGQTIRLLEQFLRFGNPEEIKYHEQHGGTISPLFEGQKDNMISSITTLATPHKGSQAADKLANKDFIKNILNNVAKLGNNKITKIDFGLSQWGFEQQPNETYIEYVNRLRDSPIWNTEDNAARDLTTFGAEDLNLKTSVNPNIVYTSFAGQATHKNSLGHHAPNIGLFGLLNLTSNLIGKDSREDWQENDGVVAVTSALSPTGQPAKKVQDLTQATEKGVWQVMPIKNDWDHVDFLGLDNLDRKRTGQELEAFYTGIIDHLMRIESREKQAVAV
ncbi:YSIRK-type signal peptide-containing protein [Staphylococcus xylosus]|uniref:YSIRK-targeted triacylglycerol lipase n=1 Tax=Staphylococcus xylosus TaxID=1288 RepID=UPI002DBD3564|nr:YSIRK-type signal peptide-containing protein [Staphylococcus xylosus]MEB6291290.1 YSIRK-type signal peptide-containing protein [Staphylococcus xylosus]MEB7720101.1 YSIRK-type signal peptide-containing protein [Staphylococcus xylosus]MEB7814041.1 YSIRK-type signal peptide-containing protein [Staphylococcus xylosus]MEB7836877.1 YSIRK-type signal peptide-containing protein [Staphylococcus xylosus]MEB7865151.1 YSIRK-type signal peptide-containing protein [Staphylococcus xylosus]